MVYHDKWCYIVQISNMSDTYGNLLIDMMKKYHKQNIQEVTEKEAKEYYEDIIKRL